MTQREALLKEVEEAPEEVLGEVLDFVRFLKAKHLREQMEAVLLSESALKKDWLRPEEDAAWQHIGLDNRQEKAV